MNVRAQKATQRSQRPAAKVGNSVIANPQSDADVAQLASADAEARIVGHQVQVALAAYFIAEKRGFEPGHELDDWLAAEAQIATAEQPSVTKAIQPAKTESIS